MLEVHVSAMMWRFESSSRHQTIVKTRMDKKLQVGVKALIVQNNKDLLLKRSTRQDYHHLDGMWDIPGGRIEIGEEPEEGLSREVKEETGNLELRVIKPLHVVSVVNNTECQIVRITYLCELVGGEVKLSDEHVDHNWFDLTSLPENTDKHV